MKSLLITGTDTDVGKTVATSALIAYWQTYAPSTSLGVMKLLQTGIGDEEWYRECFGQQQQIEIVTPLRFQTPVAPPIAAQKEGKIIDLGKIWQAFTALQQRHPFVLVEALGGLGSPITEELIVGDIAGNWRLETVLVVSVKLGAIAQTVANVALARQCGVNLKGIILNCVHPTSDEAIEHWTPIDLIQSLTHVPVLGILPYLSNLKDIEKLAQIAASWELEQFYPSFL